MPIDEYVDMVLEAWIQRAAVFVIGSGGSFACAAHHAADLRRATSSIASRPPLRVLSPRENTSRRSSPIDDYSNQLIRDHSILVVLIASPKHENIIRVYRLERHRGARFVGLSGRVDGATTAPASLRFRIPVNCCGGINVVQRVICRRASIELEDRLKLAAFRHPATETSDITSNNYLADRCPSDDQLLQATAVQPSLTGRTRPGVFLDRDGTLICFVHKLEDPEQVSLAPGAAESIRRLQSLGFVVVVVTNQGAIGEGKLSHHQLGRIHERINTLLAREGASVDGIYYCPVRRKRDGVQVIDHYYRKPGPGLLEHAALEQAVDLTSSIMVGDCESDVLAGRNAGCAHSIRVCSAGLHNGKCDSDAFISLLTVVDHIEKNIGTNKCGNNVVRSTVTPDAQQPSLPRR